MGTDGFDWNGYREQIKAAAEAGVARAAGADGVARLTAAVTSLAEGALADHPCPAGDVAVACRAGCGTCCQLQVEVLFPEALAIAVWLRKHASRELAGGLQERIDRLVCRLRWVDGEERLHLAVPCAFLDELGCCGIYPVRPLTCRSITSTDPESCRRALAVTCLDEEEPVVMNLFQKYLFDETFRALAAVLEERGLDHRSWELTRGVQAALACPPLADDFLRGRRLVCD
jgi:Fe-S-cluster containining protein